MCFLKFQMMGFFWWNFLCPQSVYICLVLEYRHISVFDCIVNCLRFARVFSLDMKFFESSRCWSCSCRLYVLAALINWSLQTFHRTHRPTSGEDPKHKQIVWQNFGQLAGMLAINGFLWLSCGQNNESVMTEKPERDESKWLFVIHRLYQGY